MRLLQRNAKVDDALRRRLRAVASTAVSGGHAGGRPVDWFFYVNGVEADEGRGVDAACAPATGSGGTATTGRRRCACPRSSAPSPSRSCTASDGKRLPVRIECADAGLRACREVQRRLDRLRDPGVARPPAQRRDAGDAAHRRRAAGPRSAATSASRSLEQGPQRSGVFARPSADGRRIALLDARGRTTAHARRAAPASSRATARRRRPARCGWSPAPTTRAWPPRRRRFDEGPLSRPLRPRRRPTGSAWRSRLAAAPARVVIYRRRASPLHAARAAAAGAVRRSRSRSRALAFEHPLVAGAVAARRRGRGVAGRRRARAGAQSPRFAVPLALAHRAGQPARRARRADGVRAARRGPAVRAGRPHGRGARLRRAARRCGSSPSCSPARC